MIIIDNSEDQIEQNHSRCVTHSLCHPRDPKFGDYCKRGLLQNEHPDDAESDSSEVDNSDKDPDYVLPDQQRWISGVEEGSDQDEHLSEEVTNGTVVE